MLVFFCNNYLPFLLHLLSKVSYFERNLLKSGKHFILAAKALISQFDGLVGHLTYSFSCIQEMPGIAVDALQLLSVLYIA